MIAGAVVATYLEWTGVLDFALLPYFLAFATYCVVEIIATVVGSEGNLFTGGRPHLGK